MLILRCKKRNCQSTTCHCETARSDDEAKLGQPPLAGAPLSDFLMISAQ